MMLRPDKQQWLGSSRFGSSTLVRTGSVQRRLGNSFCSFSHPGVWMPGLPRCFPWMTPCFARTTPLGALAVKRSAGGSADASKVLARGEHRVTGAWWRLVWQQACAEVCHRFGRERRCLQVPGARSPISAASQIPPATVQSLRLRLQELLAAEDYSGAAAVQAEMRAPGPTQAEAAQGGEVGATAFEFSMEELYRTLF